MKTSVAMFRKYRSSIHFTQRRQLKRKNPENKFISSCQNEFLMQSLISYEFLFLFYGVSFSQSSQEREGHFEGSLSNSSCSCNCKLQYLREYNWFVFFLQKIKKKTCTQYWSLKQSGYYIKIQINDISWLRQELSFILYIFSLVHRCPSDISKLWVRFNMTDQYAICLPLPKKTWFRDEDEVSFVLCKSLESRHILIFC